MSRPAVKERVALWRAELPFVKPMYAVKANNDTRLLSWLSAEGTGFDCASPQEARGAFSVGVAPQRVIYANPCKEEAAIRKANEAGIRLTTVDDPSEVHKLADAGWGGGALVRLLVDDAASKMPFGRKFGAPLHTVPAIIEAAKARGVLLHGVSFHVGSEAADGRQYANSIEDARAVFDMAANARMDFTIMDVGGGFPGSPTPEGVDKFKEHADAIRKAAALHFPMPVNWMAEPGRFFAASSTALYVRVFNKRPLHTGITRGFRYMVNDSLYAMFSGMVYDQQRPAFERVRFDVADERVTVTGAEESPELRTEIFGQSCDSLDTLATGMQFPEMFPGDYLRVRNIGAYAAVSAAKAFNGYPLPETVYALE